MSGWIAEMADAVDAHEAAPAPPMSKASVLCPFHQCLLEDTPTEPATSPRTMEKFQSSDGSKNFDFLQGRLVHEKNLKGLSTRWMVNDGRWTEEFDALLLRKARQAFNNRDMEREIEDASSKGERST